MGTRALWEVTVPLRGLRHVSVPPTALVLGCQGCHCSPMKPISAPLKEEMAVSTGGAWGGRDPQEDGAEDTNDTGWRDTEALGGARPSRTLADGSVAGCHQCPHPGD